MASGQVVPPPPPGFKLDGVPPPPPGFRLDADAPPEIASPAGLEGALDQKTTPQTPLSIGGKPLSWINQAIAGIGDSLLNTPTNLANLVKAGVGAPMVAAGRADLAPEPTAPPSYIGQLFEKLGLTDKSLDPTTTAGRILKTGLQAAVTAPIAPAQSLRQMGANMVQGGASGLTGQVTSEATGSPELGMSASLLTTPAMTAMRNRGIEQAQARDTRDAVRNQTLGDARGEGYVIPPSALAPGAIRNRLESIGGRAATGQEAIQRNQEVTNRLVRRDTGLAENTPITRAALDQRRDVLSQPYREVAAISPGAAADLRALREARNDAQGQWRFYDRSADPRAQAEARRLDAEATRLERQLEMHAMVAGRTGLIRELREARTQIAKTYDAERAINVGDGNVDPRMYGASIDRGRPLSGDAALIGRFAEAFPQFNRMASGMQAPGVSAMEPAAAAAFGYGTGSVLGAGIPLIRGPIRDMLLSNPVQNMLAPRPNTSPVLSNPYLRGLLSAGQVE